MRTAVAIFTWQAPPAPDSVSPALYFTFFDTPHPVQIPHMSLPLTASNIFELSAHRTAPHRKQQPTVPISTQLHLAPSRTCILTFWYSPSVLCGCIQMKSLLSVQTLTFSCMTFTCYECTWGATVTLETAQVQRTFLVTAGVTVNCHGSTAGVTVTQVLQVLLSLKYCRGHCHLSLKYLERYINWHWSIVRRTIMKYFRCSCQLSLKYFRCYCQLSLKHIICYWRMSLMYVPYLLQQQKTHST